MMPIEIS